ncbi:SRPBCC family protein [Nocardioides sp. GY 10113]|uniref:SRPBCC family protein n=1 Tax=Nocardioides sp. GY 10113 TaxID=2569761 RepID=UPI0010A811C8|nr:SRPBCC family protein [Nocardioides sp. GY 10113]TIC88885.1 SRPBCC family protein [Nocardioides sp. GY 10113]
MRIGRSVSGAVALSVVGAALCYRVFLRQRVLSWGARPDEVGARLPGDDLVVDPDGQTTRAVSVAARPSDVFPWLAQMGPSPRGGAYTYDWIENLFGLGMHSVDHILEQYQQPEPGEVIEFGGNRMVLELVDPPHAIAWRSSDGNWSWAFAIRDDGAGRTRLISRNRFRLPRWIDRCGMVPMEPGSLVMERRMLKEIGARAERLASSRPR